MKRFEKEFTKTIYKDIKDKLSKETYNVKCPDCSHYNKVHKGCNKCRYCGNEINLILDFDF